MKKKTSNGSCFGAIGIKGKEALEKYGNRLGMVLKTL